MATAWGLMVGFTLAAVTVVLLNHLRDLALVAIGNRIMRRLALPALLAAATLRDGDPAQAAAQALQDVEEVRRGIAGTLCAAALDAVLLPTLLLLMAVFHWAFAVFALVAALLALLSGVVAERLTRDALAEANAASTHGAAMVADAVRCAEAVEAMGMLPALVRRWAVNLARGAQRLRAAQAGMRVTAAVTSTLYGLASSGALIIGVLVIIGGSDASYGILAASLLTARVMEPLGRLGSALEDAAAARAAWSRIDALLRAADTAPPQASRAYPCPEGRLSIERVTLVHAGSPRALLREITLGVGPGDVVALVGAPGGGKSTLLRIILGLQLPNAGSVYLDGHATRHWDRTDLARHIGYLPQDPALPGGTVAEAIARLDPQPDMGAVLRAARLAGADRMIAGLPDGFATRLDGGVRLSMGQRQRVALARAVFGAPRILLLDEPAAYLDAEGEAAVAGMIAQLAGSGTAVIFASHREGLLDSAQRVFALQGGVLALAAPDRRPAPLRLTAAAS